MSYSTEEDYERQNACERRSRIHPPLWRLFREALLNGGSRYPLNGTAYEVNTETRKLVKRSFALERDVAISTYGRINERNIFLHESCRINSSCSKEKSVSGVVTRFKKVIWKRNCVANKCPIDWKACANAKNGQLECLKYLRRSQSALGFFYCRMGG